MNDQSSYLQEKEQARRLNEEKRLQNRGTLEMVKLAASGSPLPGWQGKVVNFLAVCGVLTIAYLGLNLFF